MNAATEATLAELLRVAQAQNVNLEALNQLMAGRGSGGGAAGDLTRNIGAVSSGFSIIGAAASVVGSAFEMLGNVVGKVVDGIGNTIKGLKDFTLKAMEGTAKMSDLFAAFDKLPFFIGELFGFAKSLVSIVEKMTDDYIALTKAGAGFTGSITEMRSIAAGLSLSFSDLKEITMKNSQVFAASSGDVGTGVRRFANAMKELMGPDSTLKSDIYGLGVTSKEAAEYMTTMIQVNQVNFRNGQITSGQLAVQTKEYIENLDQLSRLTGVHRDQLNAMVKKQEDDTLFVSFRDQQSKATQDLIRETLLVAETMGMTSKDIDEVIKPMIRGIPATATPAMSNFARAVDYTSIGFGNTINRLMKSTAPLSEKMPEIIAGLKSMGIGALKVSRQFNDGNIDLGALPGHASMMNQSMVALGRRTTVSGEQLAKDIEAAKKNAEQQKSIMDFHEKMTAMGNSIQEGMANMMGVVTPDLLKAGTALGEGLGNFVKSALTWFTENYASIKRGWDTIVNVFTTYILPPLQKIGAWFGETFTQLAGANNWSQFWNILKERGRDGFDSLWNALKPLWYDTVKPTLVKVFDSLYNYLQPIISRMFDRLMDKIGDRINNWVYESTSGVLGTSTKEIAPQRATEDARYNYEQKNKAYLEAKALRQSDPDAISREEVSRLRREEYEAHQEWIAFRKQWINPQKRESGGSLNPGSYLVGERGPEVMNVGASGDFTSNDNLGAALNRLANEKPTSAALEELNNTMKQLLSYSASTSENTRRTIGAIAKISGDMMPTI